MIEPLVTKMDIPKKRAGLQMIAFFGISYTVWSYIIFVNTGKWVYPILNVLNDVERVVFIISAYLLIVGLFLTTRTYHRILGRKSVKIE